VSKTRVLLADDYRRWFEYVRGLLSTNGCDVVSVVCNGQAALDAALKLRPDVVVLDISMPILNGIQVAKRLREADPNSKIVFLTAAKDPDICRAALETGALGYVWKPRLGTDLTPALQQAVRGSRFVSPGCE
jgi:DNA-binding NarL/FixJ family response regulator